MKPKTDRRLLRYSLLLVFLVVLVFGCSDGGQDTPPAVADPTPAAGQTVATSVAETPAETEVPLVVEPQHEPVYLSLIYQATEGGSLAGPVAQEIEEGKEAAEVTAVAAEGYRFVGWSDGVMNATRSDLAGAAGLTVTAAFEPLLHAVTYRVEGKGRIDGTVSQEVAHGDAAAPVTAVAAAHHHFVAWSDGVANAQRHDRNLQGALDVTARFAVDQHQLRYAAGSNGRISGVATQAVDHGKDGEPVTAVAAEGHHFVRWSDGVTTARRMDSSVAGQIAVTAEFAVNSYDLDYSAGEHGRVAGDLSQRVAHGQTGSEVEALADAGYHFVTWSDGVTSARRLDIDIRADLSVSAQFAVNTYVIGGVVEGLVEGTLLQLDNNSSEVLEISTNGDFRFEGELLDGTAYRVGVVSQPQAPNQVCSLRGAAGTIAGADVSDISIECVLQTYAIGGRVAGLPAEDQVTLRNLGEDSLTMTADGPFVFPTKLEDGSSYSVEMTTPPRKPNWVCDVLNSSGVLAGEDIDDMVVDCYPQVILKVEAGIGKVRLNWNAADFSGVTFDLCQAREEMGAGDFDNCRRLQGGNLRPDIATALIIDGLRNNQAYWFQLLARYDTGRLTFSDPVSAFPFGGLNDTGIDWCADATTNREATGNQATKTAACDAVVKTHPGQDAMSGRDKSAVSRVLKKTGSGSAGFDFTKVCRSGEHAGEGWCPPNPMPGQGYDNWACNRDNVTGLMWELKDGSGMRAAQSAYSWYQPDDNINGGDAGTENGGRCSGSGCDTYSYIAAVNKEQLCGVDNWRLPTRQEFFSIVDNGRFNPAHDKRQFPDAFPECYWTSSAYADNSQMAWQVCVLYGEALAAEKKLAKPVRLVSGESITFSVKHQEEKPCHEFIPQSTPDDVFIFYPDGAVTHKTTGLMWDRCSLGQQRVGEGCEGEPGLFTWEQALAASTSHDHAGFVDWRLPNKNELESLVEQSCSLPAINRQVFPSTPSLFFWTSSPYAGLAQGAWSVDFGYGTVSATVKTGTLPVRLVRDVVW